MDGVRSRWRVKAAARYWAAGMVLVTSLVQMGCGCSERAHLREQRAELERHVADQEDAAALLELASICGVLGDDREGTDYARRAVRASPDNDDAWRTYGVLLLTYHHQTESDGERNALEEELGEAAGSLLQVLDKQREGMPVYRFIEGCRVADRMFSTAGRREDADAVRARALAAAQTAAMSDSEEERAVGEHYLAILAADAQGAWRLASP